MVDQELADRLRTRGAVVIEGPKACGKTATALQRAASVVRLDVDPAARRVAEVDPALVLDGAIPRLLDEWQTAPDLWNHVRRAVDDRGRPGQFILTGSAAPADDVTRHTGAGRLARLRMRTMSSFETGHATGRVSLRALLAGQPAQSPDPGSSVANLAVRVAVGGWPGYLGLEDADAVRAAADYLREVHRSESSGSRTAGGTHAAWRPSHAPSLVTSPPRHRSRPWRGTPVAPKGRSTATRPLAISTRSSG